MRTLVIRASNFGDTTVGRHNHDRGHVLFEGAIQERKALNVEHVDPGVDCF